MTGVRLDELQENMIVVEQTAHGFVLPSYGVIPVYYNNANAQYELANADAISTAADALVVDVLDANNFVIQEGGVLFVEAHGLNVGEWYVLEEGTAGSIWSLTNVTGTDKNVQYLVFPSDADNLILRPDPIFVEDFFIPQDISILEDWAQGGNPTLTAGTNRFLLVAINWEDSTSTLVNGISVGGVAGTELVEQSIISGFQHGTSVFYWTDDEIDTMVGSAISITWSAGAPSDFQQSHALLEHVDQTTPVVAVNTDSGTGGTDTLDADVNTVDGGYALLSSGGGNGGMGFTNNGTGWTRKLNLTITSADGVIDDKLITTDATPENVNMSITGSNRHVLAAASLRRQE